jgi:hypothetical protein
LRWRGGGGAVTDRWQVGGGSKNITSGITTNLV